jgi:tetratricopeptide (TPR) repeat protein
MKRPREHVLEEESKRALKNLLPVEWLVTDIEPDYGLDMEVTIVEGENITVKVLKLQIKATENIDNCQEMPSLRMYAKHLVYYENYPLPVLILYYVKSIEVFYYVFAQRYIKENLSISSPDWRKQRTATIKFPHDSKLENIEDIKSVATDGYLYIILSRLNIKAEGATYWLDGIPQSDNQELKELILKALLYAEDNKYDAAIDEFENILRVCTVSPTQMMAILLNLGNAYYALSRYQNALDNYRAMLKLSKKVSERSAMAGKAAALGIIGLIYSAKGEPDKGIKYLGDALKIHREAGYKQGEAATLGNIGLVYSNNGEVDKALKYHEDALKIHREAGYMRGEAIQLGNIDLVYSAKGEVDKALKYHEDALKIDREVGYKQGEANRLCNIGIIYVDKGELDKALKCDKDALKIHREAGYKQGEASDLGKIGLIYSAKGELESARKYLEDAVNILDKFNLVKGRDIIQKELIRLKEKHKII